MRLLRSWGRGGGPFLAASGLLVVLSLAAPAAARAGSCDSAATVASDVWAQYRKTTELLGCTTQLGGAVEYGLCSATRLVNESMEDAVGWWNTAAKNRWPTIGPRTLGAEIEYGTVIPPTKRTFVSLVPSFNEGVITVDGKSGTGLVTICAVDQAGKQFKLFNDVEVKEKRAFNISRKDAEGRLLSVVIEAKLPSFKYEVQKTEVPIQWDFGPIKGLADLHVHGAAELGFAGLWLRGGHDGPQNEALAACRPLDARDAVTLAAQLKGMLVPEKEKLHSIPVPWDHPKDEEVVRHGNGHASGAANLKDWPHFSDIAHTQTHSDWLREAHRHGLQLVVMSAVNNELLCRLMRASFYQGDNKYPCDDMSNLHRQLDAFNALDQRHDWLEIALTPWHARKIIHEGKLALVLSAESSHMMPNSEGHFVTQLERMYQKGLRALQIVHERDNDFAGAAPHRKNFWWHQRTSNPLAWVFSMGDGSPFNLNEHADEGGTNERGLSPGGEKLIDAMIQRRMLIDVSHYSEQSFQDLHRLVTTKYDRYPFHASHTRLKPQLLKKERELLKEFLTTKDQALKINEVGGMIGLRTGPNHIETHEGSGVANDCPGSSKSYAQLVSLAKELKVNIAFGSDFNGVTQQLSPRKGPVKKENCYAAEQADRGKNAVRDQRPVAGAVARFEQEGLRHIGYLPDLYTDLVALKTNGAERLNDGAEHYIKMWEKAYGADVAVTVNSGNQCQVDQDCPDPKTQYCDKGLDLKGNVCRAKKADGETCEIGSGGRTCQSGTCKVNRCYTAGSKGMGQECWIGDECKVGKCNNVADGTKGTCVCKEDTDCGDVKTQYCDGGLDGKNNVCRAKKNDGDSCELVNGGRTCKSGSCKFARCTTPQSKALGETCWVGDECRIGKCNNVADGTKGTCVCQQDTDCGNGKWCDEGLDAKTNTCKRKLGKGEVCGTVGDLGVGHRCLSGKCKAVFGSTKLKCQ